MDGVWKNPRGAEDGEEGFQTESVVFELQSPKKAKHLIKQFREIMRYGTAREYGNLYSPGEVSRWEGWLGELGIVILF